MKKSHLYLAQFVALTLVACGSSSSSTSTSSSGSGATTSSSGSGTSGRSSTTSSGGSTTGTSSGQTIAAIAAGNSNLSTLVGLLQTANLVTTLNGSGPYTVFAPTNAAFDALKSAGVDATMLPVSTLTTVLENHVVSGNDQASAVEAATSLTSLAGNSIAVNVVNGNVYLNGVTQITQTNIEASNGVIHLIDSIILPDTSVLTVPGIVSAYPRLSTLGSAVSAAGLASTLGGSGPFTLFAPTNDAFVALNTAGVNATQLPVGTLTTVLENHVVSGNDPASAVEAASTLTTLAGTVNVNVTGGAVYLNGLTQITYTNIEASNGVVHLIDSVLLPNTSVLNLVGLAIAYPRLSSLAGAVTSANIDSVLEATGPFTLFAPDNAAFAALTSAPAASALPAILEYHAINGSVNSTQAIAAAQMSPPNNQVPTLDSGESLTLTLNGSTLMVNNASVIYPNVAASNGILHLIDTVLTPPN